MGILGVSFGGCSDSDDRTVTVPTTCDAVDTCAISDEKCQLAVLELTACVRDDKSPPLPPIRSLSRAQLASELSRMAESVSDEAGSGTESDPVVSSAQGASRAAEQALVALHLVTGETSLSDASVAEQAGSIAAFYRAEEKDVTVVSDTTMDPRQAMNVLAHEFTHYLQDRAGQLDVAHASNISLDESVARRSLTEGEAVVAAYRASAAMLGLNYRRVRWSAVYLDLERSIAAATEASTSPLVAAANQLPYAISPPGIEATWERSRAGVDELFDDPPLTGVDWLLPGRGTPTRAENLDCHPALPPEGYSLVGIESLGIAGAFAMLATQGAASLNAVSEWRQDLLAIYLQDSDSAASDPNVLAMWRVRFVSDQSAREFASTLEPLGLAITQVGRELAIRVSHAGDDAFEALDPNACPSRGELIAALPKRSSMSASLRKIGSSFTQ
jgi:hypothetical protein